MCCDVCSQTHANTPAARVQPHAGCYGEAPTVSPMHTYPAFPQSLAIGSTAGAHTSDDAVYAGIEASALRLTEECSSRDTIGYDAAPTLSAVPASHRGSHIHRAQNSQHTASSKNSASAAADRSLSSAMRRLAVQDTTVAATGADAATRRQPPSTKADIWPGTT